MSVTQRARVLVLSLATVATPALAQVEAGREALANADFGSAIRAFDAAEQGSLERDEYVDLLEGRAVASWASGNAERARADVAALAAIDPEHVFPPETPPDLTELFTETVAAREGPISAAALFAPSGEELTVTVRNDDLGLVSSVRAHLRSRGGAWSVVESEPPVASFPIAGERTEAWVELVGPGGAVLATAGSERSPIASELVAADVSGTPSDDSALWIGLGVGGAVLVVVAIVIGVAFAVSQSGGGAQPDAPIVVGF